MKTKPTHLAFACTIAVTSSALSPIALAELETLPVTGAAVTTELTGTVEYINRETRVLTIKTPEGVFKVIHIPDEVTRFDEIKEGNTLSISQTQAVLVDLQKGSDAGTIGATEDREIEREPGVKPAGTIVDTLTMYGKVEAVDKAQSTITVRGPERTTTFTVNDPSLLDLVAPGDGVVATYITVTDGAVTFD